MQMENHFQKKFQFFKVSILICLCLFYGCEHKTDFDDLDLHIGESIYFQNNVEMDYTHGMAIDTNRNQLFVVFAGSYSGFQLDQDLFYFFLDIGKASLEPLNSSEHNLFRFGTFVDGDQPGYRYESILDSEFYKIHYFDTINRELYIQFGCTFIRKHKNGWRLKDLPYRIDVFGAIHDTY